MKIKLGILMFLLVGLFAFSACGEEGGGGFTDFLPPPMEDADLSLEVGWTGVDRSITADLNVAMFSVTHNTAFERDIGRRFIDPLEIQELRLASTVAVAQLFNQYFPNVSINFYCPGPRTGNPGFHVHRMGMYETHGLRPHVFMSSNLPEEIIAGLVADLTMFANDPALELISPTMKRQSIHLDRIWAVPILASPVGVFVNRTLAENQNLDTPPVDWNLNQFSHFVRHSRGPDEFMGMADIPWTMFETMTDGYHYHLLHRTMADEFVFMNTIEMQNLHRGIPDFVPHALRPQLAQGNVSSPWVAGRDNFQLFADGLVLIHHDQPYLIANAGSPTSRSPCKRA